MIDVSPQEGIALERAGKVSLVYLYELWLDWLQVKSYCHFMDSLMLFLGGRAQRSRTAEVADSWTNPATGLISMIGVLKAHMKRNFCQTKSASRSSILPWLILVERI